MCLDPGTLIVATSIALTAAGVGAVAGGLENAAANKAIANQYQQELDQSRRVQKAAVEQYNETMSRNNVELQRAQATASQGAREQIMENLRRQSAAQASAASSGITGLPLQMLTTDYQQAIGGVSANLQENLKQLNENYFFNQDSARRGAQSTINSSIPNPPQFREFSVLPSLLRGVQAGIEVAGSGIGGGGAAPKAGGGILPSQGDFSKFLSKQGVGGSKFSL